MTVPPMPDAPPPTNSDFPTDPGNPFLNDPNTGGQWAPTFSSFTVAGITIWQMTIRSGSASMTVRLRKDQAESFSKLVQDSVANATPFVIPNNVPDLLSKMNNKPPGGQQ